MMYCYYYYYYIIIIVIRLYNLYYQHYYYYYYYYHYYISSIIITIITILFSLSLSRSLCFQITKDSKHCVQTIKIRPNNILLYKPHEQLL